MRQNGGGKQGLKGIGCRFAPRPSFPPVGRSPRPQGNQTKCSCVCQVLQISRGIQVFWFSRGVGLSRGGPPRMGLKLLAGGGLELRPRQAARLIFSFLCSFRRSILR